MNGSRTFKNVQPTQADDRQKVLRTSSGRMNFKIIMMKQVWEGL